MADAPQSLTMYRPDSGEAFQVAPEQASALLNAGRATFAQDQLVPVQTAKGIVQMSGADAATFLRSAEGVALGASSAASLERQQARDELGGVGGMALAGAAGFGRALTLGTSDALATTLGGEDTARTLRQLQEVNPFSSGAGEVAGMLAPALISGGSSGGARVLTALPRALSAGGEAVGNLGTRALIGLGATEGGVIARGGGMALGQALEMGAYGAGQEVSHAAVQNEQLDGERLFAAFGHGALLGGAAGGVLGTVAAGGSRAVAALHEASGRARAALEELGSTALDRATALAERVNGREAATFAPTLEGRVTRLADAATPGGLEAFATEKALTSTGASPKMLEELKANPSLRAEIARQLEEDLPALAGREKNAVQARPEMAQHAAANVERYGQEVEGALGSLDQAATKARPEVGRIVDDMRAHLAELKASPFTRREGAQLEAVVKDVRESLPAPTFGELYHQRQLLEARIVSGAPGRAGLERLRDAFDHELGRSAEAASHEVGQNFAARLRSAEEKLQAARWTEKATAHGVAQDSGALGLPDVLNALQGSNVGSTLGGALLGPVGAVVGGAAGGMMSAYVHNLAARFGDQAVASAVRQLGRGASLAQVASQTVDNVLGASVTGYLRKIGERVATTAREVGAKAKAAAPRVAEVARGTGKAAEASAVRASREHQLTDEDYQEARERIAALSAQTSRASQVARRLPPGTTPGAAQAAQATADRAVQYLQTLVPPEAQRAATLTPAARLPSTATREQQRRLLGALDVIDNPMGAIKALEAGRLDPDAIQTIRAVYPELYQSLQAQFQAALAERTEPLPYRHALELSELLGVVGDPSLEPAFIARQQTVFPAAPPGPAKGGKAPPLPKAHGGPPSKIAGLYEPGKKAL